MAKCCTHAYGAFTHPVLLVLVIANIKDNIFSCVMCWIFSRFISSFFHSFQFYSYGLLLYTLRGGYFTINFRPPVKLVLALGPQSAMQP